MAITGQDSFTGTDGAAITARSPETGSWTKVGAGLTTLNINASNQCKVIGGGDGNVVTYTQTDCGSADHYAQAVFKSGIPGGYQLAGVAVRCGTITISCIGGSDRLNDSKIYEIDIFGAFTEKGTSATGIADGDVVKLVASGASSLEMFVNGSSRCTGTSTQNSSSQLAGFYSRSTSVNPAFDDFECGSSAAGGGPVIPVFMIQYRQRWA